MKSRKSKPNSKKISSHTIISKHEKKMDFLTKKEPRLKTLEKKIKELQLNIQSSQNDKIKLKSLEYNISELQKQKDIIKKDIDLNEYILESFPLIEKFNNLEIREKSTTDPIELNKLSIEKKELTHEYLIKFEPTYNSELINVYSPDDELCKTCLIQMDQIDGLLICNLCGRAVSCLETSNDISFKERQDLEYRPHFTYEKETHFSAWLSRFQAKENIIIPQEIIDDVINECHKHRITNLHKLKQEDVRRFLKKLGHTQYYENVMTILNRINNRPNFNLTPQVNEQLLKMFKQIQEPFVKYKPKGRKSFLSYPYVLRQFFLILDLPEFAAYFPLLKTDDKLRKHDQVFEKIVNEMKEKDKSIDWRFFPSV